MKCPDCGNEVEDTLPECPHCGLALDRTIGEGFRVPGETLTRARPLPPVAPPSGSDTQPIRRKDAELRLLLSPSLPAPVEISEGKTYRVGRDRTNAVCLPSSHVSRVHAEVLSEKAYWFVSDLNSRNGTFVNGDRVIKKRLVDGDKISIGPFEITFRELTREEAREIREKKKKTGNSEDTTRVRLVRERDGVYGDVQKVSVVEVVQLLAQNRKTGCLTIFETRASARTGAEWRLFFLEGSLVHAQTAAAEGEAAVGPALAVKEGQFAFEPASNSTKVTITTPVSALLLNAI